jgi:DNA replication and repair protein RecF
VVSRRELLATLEPVFATRAGELGLPQAELRYVGEPPTQEALEARLDRDLDRGATGLGPHLDDVRIASGERELRSFGSQGEQRLAVLALLLAESELLAERAPSPPLLLLDDVLSELDAERRETLVRNLPPGGQAFVTATGTELLPVDPAQVIRVRPGEAASE